MKTIIRVAIITGTLAVAGLAGTNAAHGSERVACKASAFGWLLGGGSATGAEGCAR